MLAATLALIAPVQKKPAPAPVYKPAWVRTFSQEFDGPAGHAPDPKVWGRDIGGGGFGNNERQSYTDGPKNAFLDGTGNLVIEARKEPTTGPDGIARDYSSARLLTKGKFSQAYGKFEARLKLPRGQGIWPAFWMMGDSLDKVGWPAAGEIDIMEFLGHDTKTLYGTLHGPGYSGANGMQAKYVSPTELAGKFHTYAVEWSPDFIKWTIDGKVYGTKTPEDAKAMRWAFDGPFFMILNVAVGGNWGGFPDATTEFPQRMTIDYVRVYRDKNLKVNPAAIAAREKRRVARSQEFKAGPPVTLPGTILAVNFRPGGYKDNDAGNTGGSYRPMEGVDIGTSGSPKSKYSVGWTSAGEWMEYEVRVPASGRFRFSVDAACEGLGGKVQLAIKGKPITPAVQIPDTKGWSNWQKVDMGVVNLSKGRHIIRLNMVSGGPTGPVGNIMLIQADKV